MEAREAGVGVCIPVLNESASLGKVLDGVATALAGRAHTVVVVDDGSTDGSRELVEERVRRGEPVTLLRRDKGGPGCRRGAAMRAGHQWLLAHTGHAVFVDLDADGSQRPEELRAGVERVGAGEADVVIASKYAAGSRVMGRTAVRRLASRVHSVMLRLLLGPGIRDYSNSYRFYSRAAAQIACAAPQRCAGPVYLVEMMAAWRGRGLRFLEVPTVYDERVGGRSKVGWLDLAAGFVGALRVGLLYRAGRYG